MDRILITGGAGFIGSHLAERLLREGKRLALVDSLDDYYDPALKRANLQEIQACGPCDFFPVDLRDGEQLRAVLKSFGPEVVVHLAARPGVRASFLQPDACVASNVVGTAQLLEASRLCGVPRVVFASSSSVYGKANRAPFREDAPTTTPLSIYAATKIAGETLAYTYAQAYRLSVICLRLFTVFGPRQRPDLAIRKFARLILAGAEVPVYGDGSLQRDFTYVDDIVDGIVRALDAPGPFDVFNLGNSHPVRVDYMVDTLAQALGRPVRHRFLPAPTGEMTLTHADISKARQLLGYHPRVTFEEGIGKFAEWLRTHK
jgi:UDP-glucuronate 4-epimerase